MNEKYFDLTDNHIKLISNMYVSWDEGFSDLGVPTINQKRPYGNSSVIEDIYEIMEGKRINEDELETQGIDYDDFLEGLYLKYTKLHEETETALQIILYTKKFETGKYKKDGYGRAWVKV